MRVFATRKIAKRKTLFPEEFRVRTQSHQLYNIPLVVNPYQEEITLDMTLQATLVIAYKRMWEVLLGIGCSLISRSNRTFSSESNLG